MINLCFALLRIQQKIYQMTNRWTSLSSRSFSSALERLRVRKYGTSRAVNMVMVMVLGQLTRIITRYYLVLVGRKTTVNYLKKHGGTLKPVRRMGFYTLARLLSIQPVM